MITITKQNDGVLFTFQDSDKYLYGNGTIEVPFNTLSIIADESDMITLKKAASNDVFLSARYDTDLGYRSKDDAIDDLKGMLFAETGGGGSGSGVTPSEVQEMIDESISGKADTSDVTAVANDVQTVSGQVATKVATSDFNTYSATTDSRLAEDEEVTAAALNDLDENKQGKLVYYSEDNGSKFAQIVIEDNTTTSTTTFNKDNVDLYAVRVENDIQYNGYETVSDGGVSIGYDKMTGSDETDAHSYLNVEDGIISAEVYANEETTTVEIYQDGVTINNERVATEPYVDAALSGKADTSAVTAAIDAATSGKVDTSAITTAITSGSTDSEIPTAKAVYDAIPTGGTSVTVDPTLDSGSTNPVANSAITAALDGKQNLINSYVSDLSIGHAGEKTTVGKTMNGGGTINWVLSFGNINGNRIAQWQSNKVPNDFQLVEKSAITSAMTSSSTDAQVPSAKAVYDTLGGLKFVQCTQSEYDSMVSGGTINSSTIYFITNVVS